MINTIFIQFKIYITIGGISEAMHLVFELIGENLEMAQAEVQAVLKIVGADFTVVQQDHTFYFLDVKALDPSGIQTLESRLGLTRSAGEVLIGPCKDFAGVLEGLRDIKPAIGSDETFAVRGKKIFTSADADGDAQTSELVKAAGAAIGAATNASVDLSTPDHIFDLFVGKDLFLSKRLVTIDRKPFENRKVQFRRHFSPVSLHPKFARAALNLAECDENFLDPFCGTGGFLIEGGLMGLRVFGSDMEPKMVKGAQANLEQFGIAGSRLLTLDVGECNEWKADPGFPAHGFDAVVADPPYGRSSSTGGEPIAEVYKRAFDSLAAVIRPGGSLLLILPEKQASELGKDNFRLENIFEQFVHGSLTRYYCLFRKD